MVTAGLVIPGAIGTAIYLAVYFAGKENQATTPGTGPVTAVPSVPAAPKAVAQTQSSIMVGWIA